MDSGAQALGQSSTAFPGVWQAALKVKYLGLSPALKYGVSVNRWYLKLLCNEAQESEILVDVLFIK